MQRYHGHCQAGPVLGARKDIPWDFGVHGILKGGGSHLSPGIKSVGFSGGGKGQMDKGLKLN